MPPIPLNLDEATTVEPMTAGKFYLGILLKSNGFEVKNRLHGRDFSKNIFSMNANELLEAMTIAENPTIMTDAFLEKNRGAANQIHREVSRLVHNYLCAVSTLIDHTRNFMKEYYDNTSFDRAYKGEISRLFEKDERNRFVKDLRNYVTHKGLPDSKVAIHFRRDRERLQSSALGSDIPVEATATVTYSTDTFLAWDRWTVPARRYLANSQNEIPLRSIFEPHIETMKAFNVWFDQNFNAHHKADLEELEALITEYRRLEREDGLRAAREDPPQ